MFDLQWSWLCVPYVGCVASLATVGVVAALVRGDRVLRLGVIGAVMAALPWALCSSLAACTDDPAAALRLLRLGTGPLALIGPSLQLVLLGLSGQLERHRWVARLGGAVGAAMLALCWSNDWIVPGVRRLSSGVFYITAGPLTELHLAQMPLWLGVGLIIAWRSMMRRERRKMMQVVAVAIALAIIGASDMLMLHGVIGGYPIAWLPVLVACGITLQLELRTDLLRPRGLDRKVMYELLGLLGASGLLAGIALALDGAAPVEVAAAGSAVWMSVMLLMWGLGRRQAPPRVFGERALEGFVTGLTDVDDERRIAAGLTALWQAIAVEVRAVWWAGDERWRLDPAVAAWLADHGEPLAAVELKTMRLGPIRPRLEAAVGAHGATLIVPLVDGGGLVGLVEADHRQALREAERGLVAESARAAARALTYVQLAQAAAREGATAREVEVAEAMQRTARPDGALGPWAIEADAGAAWSASLLAGARVALLVTQAELGGVAAALATAALTGAFAAMTPDGPAGPTLAELASALAASADTVRRGGEPIAALVAILEPSGAVAWTGVGPPGALRVIEPGATGRLTVAGTGITVRCTLR